MNRYKDRPEQASDGTKFANLCMGLLRDLLHEDPHPCSDQVSQIEIGDTFEGDEFKHLQKSFYHLHIEVAERRDLDSPWVRSGIMCNRRRYICGKEDDVFIFAIDNLRQLYRDGKLPMVWHGGGEQFRNETDGRKFGTIESFVLSKVHAAKICLFRFQCLNNIWKITKPPNHQIEDEDWASLFVQAGVSLPRDDKPPHEPPCPPRQPMIYRCHCGETAHYGYNVSIRAGEEGTWFCQIHKNHHHLSQFEVGYSQTYPKS